MLRTLGLFVVPVGEVESFVKAVGHKGARWVTHVIEDGQIELATQAQEFVYGVLDSLPAPVPAASGSDDRSGLEDV